MVWTQVSAFDDPVEAMEYYIDRWAEDGRMAPIEDLVSRFDDEEMVSHLKTMFMGAEDGARRAIVQTMARIAQKSSNDVLRQDVVFNTLVNAVDDPKRHSELTWLSSFRGGDFNKDSRRALLKYLEDKLGNNNGSVRVDARIPLMMGRAGMREAIPMLEKLDELERAAGYNAGRPLLRRNALLVLARFGDSKAIEEAIGLIEQMEDDEDRVVWMRDLAYLSQPQVVEYFKKYFFSDVVYETNSRDVIPVSEADYAAEALGRMLEGFPEKASLEEQRAWMSAQTTYRFKGVRGDSDGKESTNNSAAATGEEPLLTASSNRLVTEEHQGELESEGDDSSNLVREPTGLGSNPSEEVLNSEDNSAKVEGDVEVQTTNEAVDADNDSGSVLLVALLGVVALLIVVGILYRLGCKRGG